MKTNKNYKAVTVVLVLLAVAALPIPVARAQAVGTDQSGDAAEGLRLAQAWCTECHAIGTKTQGKAGAGPAFRDVAQRPKTTALSLSVFLRSNHDNMPNFIIPRGEADDIIAYILSLRGR